MTPLAFVRVARALASLSKDPSTKVGAVIVGPDLEIRAVGYNGFPRGVVDDPDRYADRDLKYDYIVHAEANAIANAARAGTSTLGCSLVVTSLYPCGDCAKVIIQAGIKKIYAPKPHTGNWADSMTVAEQMFQEAGVEIVHYEDDGDLR